MNLHASNGQVLTLPLVQRVCNVLTLRGQQTLPEVVRASKLPPAAVRSALLVLLQHNLAISELVQPEAGLRAPQAPYFLYHADTGAIISILRWAITFPFPISCCNFDFKHDFSRCIKRVGSPAPVIMCWHVHTCRRPRILQHVQREFGGPGDSDLVVKIIEVALSAI